MQIANNEENILPNDRYGLSRTTYLRYSRFIKEYIKNGFNGTQAYKTVYKSPKDDKTCQVEASRLLSIPMVHNILCDELKGIDLGITEEWIKLEIKELLRNAKLEATKSRMLELLAKIGGITKETGQNIAIFNTPDEERIVHNRLHSNNLEQ